MRCGSVYAMTMGFGWRGKESTRERQPLLFPLASFPDDSGYFWIFLGSIIRIYRLFPALINHERDKYSIYNALLMVVQSILASA